MTIGSTLQKKIHDYLLARGYPSVIVLATSRNGTSDVIACIEGKYAAIEVKAGNDTEKLLQEIKIRNIRKAKGYGIFARSLQDVRDLINLIIRELPESHEQ